MIFPWTDPLVLGGVALLCLIVLKSGHALWVEHKRRRHQRLLNLRDIRHIIGDYRAKYGTQGALAHLQEDLEATKIRMEKLAVRWRRCQEKAAETVEARERSAVEEEERHAYRDYAVEARRLQQLKRAHEHLKQ